MDQMHESGSSLLLSNSLISLRSVYGSLSISYLVEYQLYANGSSKLSIIVTVRLISLKHDL